jgi:hypothetical protein
MQGQPVNEYVFVETQLREKSPRYTALRTKEFKYIETKPWRLTLNRSIEEMRSWVGWLLRRPRFLYRLKEDPSETINLIEAEREAAGRLRAMVKGVARKNGLLSQGVRRERKPKMQTDEDVAKQLEALGYFER